MKSWAIGLVLAAAMAVRAQAACPLPPMQSAADLEGALAAYGDVVAAGADCSGAQRDWAARIVAAYHVDRAERLMDSGGTPDAVLALLDAALRYATPWQALAMRGDVRQRIPAAGGEPDFAAASQDYQAALNAIDAADPEAEPVPEPIIASIWRKAEQTRMLAERPVSSPPTRAGAPGGLEMGRVRSFKPVGVAIPVQFEFGRAAATPAGAAAAEELAKMLAAEGQPAILLIGHTDPVGTDAYNLQLSQRRAEAVRQFLIGRGYPPGRIRAEGHGQRDPLQIEGADGYSAEQINQILRRVEVRRP